MAVAEAFSRRSVPSSGFVRRLAREPLLHFMVLGALIFAGARLHDAGGDPSRIVIDDARAAKLAQTYAQQFGGRPSPATMRTLIANDIDEEVLYREGLAMKLDRDDEVIRRRIVQKVQFLEQDLAPPAAPSDAALRDFYEAHRARYVAPPRLSFTHVFFSPDMGGDAAARARAAAALAKLDAKTTRAPERGDAYPDLYDYSSIGPDEAARLFGNSEIAHALFRVQPGKWSGPFRSGYGWHLVYASAVQREHALSFEQAREQVRDDYRADAQSGANDRAFAALKARYTIVREDHR